MLKELTIRDFAIIDYLRLEMAHGFTVLTGETGAGKSIILDALSLVLGERADKSMVRAGKDQALIDATFSLTPAISGKIGSLIEREGLENEQPDQLHLGREIVVLETQHRALLAKIRGIDVAMHVPHQ